MSIFTRTIEPNTVAILLLILEVLLHTGIYIVSFILTITEQTYVSDKLPPVGYIIDKKFHIKKNYEHFLNKRPTVFNFLMHSSNLLLNIAVPFVIISCAQFKHSLPYLFISIVSLAVALIRWYHELRKVMFTYKHDAFLMLIEMCHMPYSAASTTLLFRDRDNNIYTYVVRDVSSYTLGKCYAAHCLGTYIEELSQMSYNPDDIRYVPKRVLSSRCWLFGFIPVTVLIVLSIILFACNAKFNNTSLYTLSVTLFLNALLLVPWPLKRKLTVVALRHSEMFKDLTHTYSYTFILVDKGGNTYYYTTDDRKALEKFVTIQCKCMGRRILSPDPEAIYLPKYKYKEPMRALPFIGVLFIAAALWALLELLGLDTIAQVIIILVTAFYVRLFRYISRGEY